MVLDDVKLSHGSDSSSYALWPDWCPKWIRWVFILDPSVEFPTAVDVGSCQVQEVQRAPSYRCCRKHYLSTLYLTGSSPIMMLYVSKLPLASQWPSFKLQQQSCPKTTRGAMISGRTFGCGRAVDIGYFEEYTGGISDTKLLLSMRALISLLII